MGHSSTFRFRSLAFMSVVRVALLALGLASGVVGCETLIGADFVRSERGQIEGGTTVNESGTPCGEAGACGAFDAGALDGAVPNIEHFDDAQKRLEAARRPGPVIGANATGTCTSKRFFWHTADGAAHSWTPANTTRIDYDFKVYAYARGPYVSDTYVISAPTNEANVYSADQPSHLVTTLQNTWLAASDEGVFRLELVDLPIPTSTNVRYWRGATGAFDTAVISLDTVQPYSSFNDDTLVMPSGVTPPFVIWMVNAKSMAKSSVAFDVGLGIQETVHGPDGLIVSYPRTSGAAGLRVYRGDKDDAASRIEIGDEVAKRSQVFPDSLVPEHNFVAGIAAWRDHVLYGGTRGIWSYNLTSGALVPVQLNAEQKVVFPDVFCVIRDANLLVYRMSGDAETWTVPLE